MLYLSVKDGETDRRSEIIQPTWSAYSKQTLGKFHSRFQTNYLLIDHKFTSFATGQAKHGLKKR